TLSHALGVMLWNTYATMTLWNSVTPDIYVLAGSTATVLIVALLVGLLPASAATRTREMRLISSRTATPSMGRLGNLLLVAQVTASIVLVVGAGLLLQTFGRLRTIGIGTNTHG